MRLFPFFCVFLEIISSAPHILFIVIDDLGYTDLGYHGAEFNTSNLDSLAISGIDLTSYYVGPVCTPTRSSFMTGLYPWRIGFQQPMTMMAGVKAHIPFNVPIMPELLKMAGYNTQMIGKWHLGYASTNMTPTGRGFNDYFGYYNGAEDYYTHDVEGGYDLVYNNIVQKQLNGTYNADSFFKYFNNYLTTNYNKSNSNNYITQPLFMYLALQTIHAPIEKPPMVNMYGKNMSELYDKECGHINDTMRRFYCEKLQYIDIYIGELIEMYKKLNLWDDTFLVVTTDNGGMPNHNQTSNTIYQNFTVSAGQNYPLRAGKVTLFQGGALGLSFVSGPLIPNNLRGTTNNNYYGCIDWLPSLLAYVGYNNLIPNNLDGKNIMDSLLNNKTFDRTRFILDENFDAVQEITVGSLIEGCIIDNDWKYIHGAQLYNCYYPAPPASIICLQNETITDKYLFYLKDDPYESNNLIEQYPEKVDYLIGLLVEDAINNGYVVNYINDQWNSSCPQWHNGSWLPWLDTAPVNDILRPNCVFV